MESGGGAAGGEVSVEGEPAAEAPAAAPATGGGDPAKWEERIREKLVSATGYPAEMLETELDLEADLGVDSVQRAEIWVSLTSEHGLDSESRPAGGTRTIAQLAEALAGMESGGGAAGGEAPAEEESAADAGESETERSGGARLFAVTSRPGRETSFEPFECRRVLAVTGESAAIGTAIKKRLAERDVEFTAVRADSLAEMGQGDVETLLDGCDTLLYVAHADEMEIGVDGEALLRGARGAALRIYRVFRNLVAALEKRPLRIMVPISQDGAFGSALSGRHRLLGAFPAGFVRCLSRELPGCIWQLLDTGDVAWEEAVAHNADRIGDRLELGAGPLGVELPALAPISFAEEDHSPLERGDLVLVTGGARGVVFECVSALAERTGCRLLLTGRTERFGDGERPAWLESAAGEVDDAIRQEEIRLVREEGIHLGEAKKMGHTYRAQWELERNLSRLSAAGIEAGYEVCDVSEPEALSELVRRVSEDDEIRGVVHGAGVQRSKLIGELEDEVVDLTLKTKLAPLCELLDSLDWTRVRLLSAFGSIAGLFGNAGQSDYGLANDMMAWLVAGIGRLHPRVRAQTVEWTAWVGTGMVTDEEAKRFSEAGLSPLTPALGTRRYLEALLRGRLPRMACFNAGAAFADARPVVETPIASRPVRRLLSEPGGDRARFSLERDVYLLQHLVNGESVLPGTFIAEIFAESAPEDRPQIGELSIRRPLRVPAGEEFEVEVLSRGDELLLLPANRPENLEDKGLFNLAFASCRPEPVREGEASKLRLEGPELEMLRADAQERVSSLYETLDAHFSRALTNGRIFRGIVTAREGGDRFLALMTLTEEALSALENPGELVFNPVLADMAVQAAAVWNMQRHDVFAIPVGIGSLYVAGDLRGRETAAVLRGRELGEEGAVLDVAVRELDGRLVLAMDRLELKTIARRDG